MPERPKKFPTTRGTRFAFNKRLTDRLLLTDRSRWEDIDGRTGRNLMFSVDCEFGGREWMEIVYLVISHCAVGIFSSHRLREAQGQGTGQRPTEIPPPYLYYSCDFHSQARSSS